MGQGVEVVRVVDLVEDDDDEVYVDEVLTTVVLVVRVVRVDDLVMVLEI